MKNVMKNVTEKDFITMVHLHRAGNHPTAEVSLYIITPFGAPIVDNDDGNDTAWYRRIGSLYDDDATLISAWTRASQKWQRDDAFLISVMKKCFGKVGK